LADKKFEEVEGGLQVNGVKILAAGTWTDSYQQTPCTYSPKLLEKYASNWKSNGFWLRHAGGSPRSIDEKVGEILNPRFESDAVMGDVFLHMASSRSRDYAEMAKRGVVEDVSAELGTTDTYDKATKTYNATYLEFTGVAAVDRGACTVCGLRGHGLEDCPEEKEAMETAEFEKMLAAFKVDILGEMDKKFSAIPPTVKPEELKGLSDALEAEKVTHEALTKTYEERIKRLENAPDPKTLGPIDPHANDGLVLDRMELAAKLPNITSKEIVIR